MTITTTDTVERYVGDGSQTAWPITFPFFKGEDVKACIVNGAGEQVNLTYGVDYTVNKSTSSIGGTLSYTLADGVELTIWLNLPITQPTDFYNTGPLNAEVLEDAFDRLTLIAQQLWEASGRSIKVETSSTKTPDELLAKLYAGRDAAVASASAAATSESNAADSKQAAATSENNAADSESAAAGSASTAEAWAESETAPDPNDADSKSAKTWAMIAGDSIPIATEALAGKAKTSASWQVDPDTGVAIVPAATDSLAGIARKATNAEVVAGENDDTFMTPLDVKTVLDACRASTDDMTAGTSMTKFPSVAQIQSLAEGKADADTPALSANAYVVETYKSSSGDAWYRVWSDGFIEQGGEVSLTPSGSYQYTTVSLPKAFTSSNYTLVIGHSISTSDGVITSCGVTSKTITNFRTGFFKNQTTDINPSYHACGY